MKTNPTPEIPAGSGEFVIFPQNANIADIVTSNKLAIESIAEEKKTAKNDLLTAAKRYMVEIGLATIAHSPPPESVESIIMTGHQPGFTHSGIVFKELVAHFVSKKIFPGNSISLNLIVDSDDSGIPGATLPASGADGYFLSRVDLPLTQINANHMVCEQLTANPGELIESLSRAISESMTAEELNPVTARALNFLSGAPKLFSGKSLPLADIFAKMRRSYFAATGNANLEVPLSLLGETQSFVRLFYNIASRAEEFLEIYNAYLADYRQRHQIRSKANPFPDLKHTGGFAELPFWIIRSGSGRHRMFAKILPAENNIELFAASGDKSPSDSLEKILKISSSTLEYLPGELKKLGLSIRPKAIPLLIYNKVYLSDLFIQGIGGFNYEPLADEIISKFMNLTPPISLCATLTLLLKPQMPDYSGELNRLGQDIRQIEFQPERFLINPEQYMGLLLEKKSLLNQIKLAGQNKKVIAARIEHINHEINSGLGNLKHDMRAKQMKLTGLERSRNAINSRELPYFLFDPLIISGMAERGIMYN